MKITSHSTLYARPGEPVEPGTPVDVPTAEGASLIVRGLAQPYAGERPGAQPGVPLDSGPAAWGRAKQKVRPGPWWRRASGARQRTSWRQKA